MRYIILSILAAWCNLALAYTSALDTMFPIKVESGIVTTPVEAYTLDEQTILLDMEATPGEFVFNDVTLAIKAINGLPKGKPVTLLVAPGVYWIDNPDDPEIRDAKSGIPYGTTITCDTLEIKGLHPNAENAVFAANRGQTQGAIGNFTMIHFIGKSLDIRNMTIGNYCNVDLEYPLVKSLSRKRRADAIVQAQLGICEGTDRLFSTNCRYISRLNLCPMVGSRRSLYKDCHFESTDDALTGSAVYLGCHFTFHSSKPFYNTPPTGAVFLDCDIDLLNTGVQYLTKVPGPVTLIDTRFHSKGGRVPAAMQWTRDLSATVCYQYNVTLDGNPIMMDCERPQLTVDLTGKDALGAYRVTDIDGNVLYNTPSLLGGDDDWDPLSMRDRIIAATGSLQSVNRPVAILFDKNKINLAATGDTLSIKPIAVKWGNYPLNETITDIDWSFPSVVALLAVDNTHSWLVRSQNSMPEEVNGYVTAAIAGGLKGVIATKVAAYLTEPPTFTSAPAMFYNKKSKSMYLEYKLDKEDDRSHIVWYRYKKADLSDTIPVFHGLATRAGEYRLTAADVGYKIYAKVTPQAYGTYPGTNNAATLNVIVSQRMVAKVRKAETLKTDFSDVPVHRQPLVTKGCWSFDCYKPADTDMFDWAADDTRPAWYYGYGTDGAVNRGLVQATRGARTFYTPMAQKAEFQSVVLNLEPCKPAGQGFGSATGQYMDIYIGFDASTLSGYALRIQRTPNYDRAVVFSLVRYNNGTVQNITAPVPSSCFRTTCTVSLTIENGQLTAIASSTAPAQATTAKDVVESVELTARITTIPGTSIGVQHTGTTGASATLIRDVEATWR
ncbi:MAG: hypothetical protein J1E84_04045 [Muribaculaceae bacterium]|nr:hypothetical protein [Muribaculaceae bacterium]